MLLETDDTAVGVSNEDDIAFGLAAPPLVRP
jgi:hypothetical protein